MSGIYEIIHLETGRCYKKIREEIMERTNIYIPTPMLARLRALATERGISVAELVRRAVEDFLKRQK